MRFKHRTDYPDHLINRYPIYVISKGRPDIKATSYLLSEFGLKHYVAVEKHEVDIYKKNFKTLSPKAEILEMPFSNHGKGSGPARNWCWEHSKNDGFKRHWLLDDNIWNFWRFYENMRLKVATGSFFRSIEDYVDRFENVPLSGLQYKFFCMDDYKHPPYIMNTRIMSVLLIENDCPHMWRGRYNEDVDLSLRILKDKYCTMLFYNFLQGKAKTQSVKGGNTTEIYGDGTLKKSQMLVDMHPDVVTLEKKYGRWHHHVDIRPFRNNRPIVKPKEEWPIVLDPEYGMALTTTWDEETLTFENVIARKDVKCFR